MMVLENIVDGEVAGMILNESRLISIEPAVIVAITDIEVMLDQSGLPVEANENLVAEIRFHCVALRPVNVLS